ncbi:MAG: hypothetical protein WDZ49_15190 [Litorilinea sp.]
MTRTRMVFFTILGIFLVIIAASISMQIMSEQLLRQIFIAGTVFGMGVVALDFLGIFGGSSAGDAGGDAGGLDSDFDGSIEGDAGTGDAVTGETGGGGSVDADGDVAENLSGDIAKHGDAGTNLVLSMLAYLRLMVYFFLGFGPMGLVALLSGRAPLVALLLAVPVGVVAIFLALAFFRFQRSDTDSTVQGKELLMREATVTVPLTHTTMGRVRLQIGMSVVDPYALAEDPAADLQQGDTVRIVRVTPDCVYVR